MSKKNPTKAIPVEHMRFMSTYQHNNDADIIKGKHIKSPDLTKFPFRLYDYKMKITVFFKSAARMKRYIDMKNDPEQSVSFVGKRKKPKTTN